MSVDRQRFLKKQLNGGLEITESTYLQAKGMKSKVVKWCVKANWKHGLLHLQLLTASPVIFLGAGTIGLESGSAIFAPFILDCDSYRSVQAFR